MIKFATSIVLGALVFSSISVAALEKEDFSEGMAIFRQSHVGFINNKGELAIEPIFVDALPFSDGLAYAKDEEFEGYINKKGKWVIKEKRIDQETSRFGNSFQNGLACATDTRTGKQGFIDKTGKWAIPPKYDTCNMSTFSDGLGRVGIEGKFGFVDQKGSLVIPALFKSAGEFSEGLADAKRDNAYGYIDKSGEYVIPPIFQGVSPFVNGRARVELNGKYGYIDKEGKFVVPAQLNNASDFSEEFAAVTPEDTRKYFIGKTQLGPFTNVINLGDFHDGRARLIQNQPFLTGYLDSTGNIVIPVQFNSGNDFHEGLALVRKNEKEGYIDKSGAVVIPFGFSEKWKDLAMKLRGPRQAAHTKRFRENIAEGDASNCGKVLEVRKHSVKIYRPIENYGNEHWIDRDKIFPFGYGCLFTNGEYVTYKERL